MDLRMKLILAIIVIVGMIGAVWSISKHEAAVNKVNDAMIADSLAFNSDARDACTAEAEKKFGSKLLILAEMESDNKTKATFHWDTSKQGDGKLKSIDCIYEVGTGITRLAVDGQEVPKS